MDLREHMKLRKVNASTLAERAGVSTSTITRLLHGHTIPTRRTLEAISDATNGETSAQELMQLCVSA